MIGWKLKSGDVTGLKPNSFIFALVPLALLISALWFAFLYTTQKEEFDGEDCTNLNGPGLICGIGAGLLSIIMFVAGYFQFKDIE